MLAAPARAAQETHDYDAAGRLRSIQSEAGHTTRFVYDAVGNLLSVSRVQLLFPPEITGVEPGVVRAGEVTRVSVTGRNLAEATVSTPSSEFQAGNRAAADSLGFDLDVDPAAPLGEQTFRLVNADGDASFVLTVLPPLPLIRVSPLPLALPNDGSWRRFLVRLSSPDTVDHPIGLSLTDTGVAELEATSVTIPAGETEVQTGIRGLVTGLSTLQLRADGLEPAAFSVYVTAEYGNINSAYADALGVQLGDSAPPPATAYNGWSPGLGVVTGPFIDHLSPPVIATGSTGAVLGIHGVGLDAVQSVSIQPLVGLTLAEFQVNADGTRIDLPLDVAADAAVGWRWLRLDTASRGVPPASPAADRLYVSAPLPRIESVSPTFGLLGSSGLNLLIRGRNLGDPVSLAFEPPDGLTVGAGLNASADGSSLGATVTIAADAPLGERTVILRTAAGGSATVREATNTFIVTDRVIATLDTLIAPQLGVELGDGGAIGSRRSLTDYSSRLGLTMGPAVTAAVPRNGEIATSLELRLEGNALEGATVLRLEPADGVSVAQLTVDPTGEFVSAVLDIASDAPQTWRRLRLWSAGGEIPFADRDVGRFLITAPLPQLRAVSPNTLQTGTSANLTLYGRNLDRVSRISAVPPDGLTFGSPTESGDGRSLVVNVSALADAADGPRTLVVTTAAGDSTDLAEVGNTLTLYTRALASPRDFTAPLLGVELGQGDGGNGAFDALLAAPLVGVELAGGEGPGDSSLQTYSASLGIALGGYVASVEAPPLLAGDTYVLTLRGQGLEGLDGAAIFPGIDVAVGLPLPSADGTWALLEITVDPGVLPQPRELRLVAGERVIPFTDPGAARLYPAAGVPDIVSMTPITGRPGEVVDLLVRGEHLQNAVRVTAEPLEGIVFEPAANVNADGTELRIRLYLAEDVALGGRTIRIETPGGASASQASPANTFTVF